MARVGLTLCLITVTLAGPWLCCCASVRWITSLSTPATSIVAPRKCCGGPDRGPDSKQSNKPNREQRSPTPLAPCSCERGQSPIILENVDIGRIDFWAELTDTINGFGDFSIITTTIVGAAPLFQTPAHFPHLTAQGILRALSVMRC